MTQWHREDRVKDTPMYQIVLNVDTWSLLIPRPTHLGDWEVVGEERNQLNMTGKLRLPPPMARLELGESLLLGLLRVIKYSKWEPLNLCGFPPYESLDGLVLKINLNVKHLTSSRGFFLSGRVVTCSIFVYGSQSKTCGYHYSLPCTHLSWLRADGTKQFTQDGNLSEHIRDDKLCF